MALELKLAIEVEKAAAQRALSEVESGIKKVESAAKSTQDPIAKVTDNVSQLAGSKTKLSDAAQKSHDALEKEVLALIKQDAALLSAKSHQEELSTATLGWTSIATRAAAVTGLSTTATVALSAGLAAAAAATLAGAAIVAKSTQHYFEHAEATRDSRDALSDLARGWGDFQMMVGGATLGGNFSIAQPVHLLNAALLLAGGYIAENIERTKAWALALAGLHGGLQQTLLGIGMGVYADPARGGDMNLPFERQRDPRTGMTQDQFIAEAQIAAMQARMRAARQGNVRRTPLGTAPAPFQVPGVAYGIPGYAPYSDPFSAEAGIPIGVPPIYWSGPGYTGLPSVLPGTQVPIGGIPGAGPGFWGRNFSNPFARGGAGLGQYGMNLYGAGSSLAYGAGAVWDATGDQEAGAGKRALSGAATGAQVGMMFGPWGAAIGAGVGALVGAIKGWLAPTEYEKRKKEEAQNRAQAGELLGRPGMEQFWNSVGAGNTPFDFAFLKTQVEHDPGAIKGYLDDMLAKHERLQAAMEKYGISWEELGEKAKQSQIDTMASELIQDFDVLLGAGANVDLIIQKMGGSINDFVLSALRTQTEVPQAMQPMIEKMIEMGLLTDENGKAFGSLEETGLTFAKTMTQGFKDIVEAINRVAKGLGVDIPEAIDKIPKDVGINVRINEMPHRGDLPNPDWLPPGGGDFTPEGPWYGGDVGEPLPRAHRGAYVGWSGLVPAFHRGGEVLARLLPGEFVMQRSAVNRIGVSNLAAMNRGSGGVTIILEQDGRRTARWLVPHIGEEVLRVRMA